MNSAARVVSNTRKFDSVSRVYCTTSSTLSTLLTWVQFKLATLLTRRWLHGTAPPYLVNSCTPTADVAIVVSISGPPVNGSWSFRVIIWTVSVVGVLLSRARRPGIRYLTVFATQHWVSTYLGVSWRHSFGEILPRCSQRIRDVLIW